MHADDIWVPERGRQVRLSNESLAIVLVGRYIGAQNLERVLARQPWVLDQINLAHSPGPEQPHNGVSRKQLTATQRHTRILPPHCSATSSRRGRRRGLAGAELLHRA